MAISYTDLTGYFDEQLGDIKASLGISTYNDTVTRILLDYGIDADFNTNDAALNTLLADATDKNKLIVLALMHLWKYALALASIRVRQSADGLSLDAQQLFEHCKMMFDLSKGEAKSYLSSRKAKVGAFANSPNPYEYLPADQRLDPNDLYFW